MTEPLSADDARSALLTVDLARRRVVAEVGLPPWYWAGLAAGWVALGLLGDLGHAVLSVVATVAFGAAHAAVASRLLDGRRRTGQLQVRAGLVTRHLPWLLVGGLVVLVGLTVAAALVLAADGAEHPGTIASLGVAVVVLLGGPRLVAAVRHRALRISAAA